MDKIPTENDGKTLVQKIPAPEGYRFTGEHRRVQMGDYYLTDTGKLDMWDFPKENSTYAYPILEPFVDKRHWWEFDDGDIIKPFEGIQNKGDVNCRMIVLEVDYEPRLQYIRFIDGCVGFATSFITKNDSRWSKEKFVKIGDAKEYFKDVP